MVLTSHMQDNLFETKPVIQFDNVSYRNQNNDLFLDKVSFSIREKEKAVIVGPEGSGRGAVIELIMGKAFPLEGTVKVFSQEPASLAGRKKEALFRRVGYISYNSGLINNMSVIDNVMLPLLYHETKPSSEVREIAESYLRRYSLDQKMKDRPQLLRQSEKLAVSIVRAILAEPRIIVVDNAFDGQCPIAGAKLFELMEEDIRIKNSSLLFTSYHPVSYTSITDERMDDYSYFLMYCGKIVFHGNAEDMRITDNNYVRQYLDHPLTGPMKSGRGCEVEEYHV